MSRILRSIYQGLNVEEATGNKDLIISEGFEYSTLLEKWLFEENFGNLTVSVEIDEKDERIKIFINYKDGTKFISNFVFTKGSFEDTYIRVTKMIQKALEEQLKN